MIDEEQIIYEHFEEVCIILFTGKNLDWIGLYEAFVTCLFFLFNILIIICFPITIPLAIYLRIRHTKKRIEKRATNPLANRVQKLHK